MSDSYWERVKKNLFPKSVEKEDIDVALEEWYWNLKVYYLVADLQHCQLCDHKPIRYAFEIVNRLNGNLLWIGSECVKRFKFEAIDKDGKVFNSDDTAKKVDQSKRKLITDAAKIRAIVSLVILSNEDEEFTKEKIESFITYLHVNDGFTPKQLNAMVWRLKKYKIEHTPSDFKMIMKKKGKTNELKKQLTHELELWQVKQILPYMSKYQQEWCEKNRKDLASSSYRDISKSFGVVKKSTNQSITKKK